MKITVNAEKVRAELLAVGRRERDSSRLCPSETELLIAKLQGGNQEEIGRRIGKSRQSVSTILERVRNQLAVRDDLELAYLAIERGYVTVEEDA
jgi:DNA-binding NarL/FixJ family response regulator